MPGQKLNNGAGKKVVIVVPIYKGMCTADEDISLKHLRHYLGKYDKYLIAPEDLEITFDHANFFVKRFSKKHFWSIRTYSKFLLSNRFYESFIGYEYILIYQLDCLVFSDQLMEWCSKGYDYIGAPWYRDENAQLFGKDLGADRVGNGGFSLRRVASHLKLLKLYNQPVCVLMREIKKWISVAKVLFLKITKRFFETLIGKRGIAGSFKTAYNLRNIEPHQNVEDMVLCIELKEKYPHLLHIAPPEVAVSFSFEFSPAACFKKNGNNLPFGCHGWAKFDRAFWEPYLL